MSEPTGLGTVALADVQRSMYVTCGQLSLKSSWEEAFQSMWVERTTNPAVACRSKKTLFNMVKIILTKMLNQVMLPALSPNHGTV